MSQDQEFPKSSSRSWANAIVAVARDFELSPSPEQIRLLMVAAAERPLKARVLSTAAHAGLKGCFTKLMPGASTLAAPFIVELKSGECAVVRAIDEDKALLLMVSDDAVLERAVFRTWLDDAISGPVLVLAPRGRIADRRIDAFLAPYKRSWFATLLRSHFARFVELAGGAFFGNVLALSTAIFAMQIWDRVIPAKSIPTLWVLALGVGLSLVFELAMKMLRTTIADGFGKELDLKMSAMFFARALDVRNDARPKSPGTLIAQLRELDQVRELMTSTSLSVLFELPFALLFIGVIALIGGPLVYVLLAIIPIVLTLCLVMQWPLARLSREGLRESAMRNAMLVESIERIEDIKSLQAEARYSAVWERLSAENARIGKVSRFYTALLTNAATTLQQAAYVAVLVAGVYLVLEDKITVGALLACSMLTSRAIAPLTQVASVFAKWQAAAVARKGLDTLLQLPTDHGSRASQFHRPVLLPDIVFEQVAHAYEKGQKPALTVQNLSIKAGERVAIIGRIGSGKSTLLKLAAGLMPPSEGRILIDGTDITSIHMADIRRDIGCYHQDAGLFTGTVRFNLQLGAPDATDEELIAALTVIGPSAQLFTQGQGLDMIVHEGGRGLSSGQRQALILARAMVRWPRALLLDEPTGAMDENTERTFVANLKDWLGPRTLIVATHRYALLDIATRVIVVDQGRIALDGPRDVVVQKLSSPAGPGKEIKSAKAG